MGILLTAAEVCDLVILLVDDDGVSIEIQERWNESNQALKKSKGSKKVNQEDVFSCKMCDGYIWRQLVNGKVIWPFEPALAATSVHTCGKTSRWDFISITQLQCSLFTLLIHWAEPIQDGLGSFLPTPSVFNICHPTIIFHETLTDIKKKNAPFHENHYYEYSPFNLINTN